MIGEGDVVRHGSSGSVVVEVAPRRVVLRGRKRRVAQGSCARSSAVGPVGGLSRGDAVLRLPGAASAGGHVLAPRLTRKGVAKVHACVEDVELHSGCDNGRVSQPEGDLMGRTQRHAAVGGRLADPGHEHSVDPEFGEAGVKSDQVVSRIVDGWDQRSVDNDGYLAHGSTVRDDGKEDCPLVPKEGTVRRVRGSRGSVHQAELGRDAKLEVGRNVLHVCLEVDGHRELLREELVRVDVGRVARGHRVASVHPQKSVRDGHRHRRQVLLPDVRVDGRSWERPEVLRRVDAHTLSEVGRRVVGPHRPRDGCRWRPGINLARRADEPGLVLVDRRVDEKVAVCVRLGNNCGNSTSDLN